MNKKIFILVFLYAASFNSYAENSDVLMRMYERLEMIRIQMQQLTEENQQLNNKIISLQDQQDRLYQDLSKKIEVLNSNLEKNNINIGAGSRVDIQKKELIKSRKIKTSMIEKKFFFNNLSKIGYSKKITKDLDKDKYLRNLTKAFQRRFRQELINSEIDRECLLISINLLKR